MRRKTKLLSSALVFALGMGFSVEVKENTGNFISDFLVSAEFHMSKEAEAALCSTPERFLRHCCPRPCPVLDTSKLSQVVSQVTAETSKVTQYISQLTQWQEVLKSIGLDIGGMQGILSMFKNAGSMPSMGMLTENVSQTLTPKIQDINLESIPDITTKMSNLYVAPGATQEIITERSIVTKGSIDASLATSMDAQKKIESQDEKLKELAKATAKSKTRREDWAANTAAKIALLEAFNDAQKLNGAFNQMMSMVDMMGFGSISSGGGSFSSSSTPFTANIPANSDSDGPMNLDPNATALYQAITKINNAVTIHNQAVAVKEMLQGYQTAQQMRDTWAHYEGLAVSAYNNFIAAMGAAYVNPATSGKAIYDASYSYASGPYSDMLILAPQLNSVQYQMMAYLKQNAEYYGTLRCMFSGGGGGGSSGGGGGGSSSNDVDCKQQSRNEASEAASGIYNTVFNRKQADWYYQFEVQGEELQKQATEQIQIANEFIGMDLTNLEAVTNVVNNLIYEANQIAPIGVINAFVEGTANDRAAKNMLDAIQKLEADNGYNYYISYDNDIGSVEITEVIFNDITKGDDFTPVEPDTEFIPGAE